MEYHDIRFDLAEGVATITLDRPDELNTFTGVMGRELGHAWRRCDEDDAVRVVILTGAGRVFCAGADLSAGAEPFAKQDEADFSASPVEPPAWMIRKPVIAALNGSAVGLGLTLALQCDFRIAAEDAKFGILQVRRGVMPDAYAHWTLPRIVGMERAAFLLLTGRKLTGREAEQMGLVLRAVPAARVLTTALELARDIVENTAPLSVAVTKRLLWQSPGLAPDEVEHLETQLHHHLMGAPDAIEGARAYLERRRPQWTSRVGGDWPEWPKPPKKTGA